MSKEIEKIRESKEFYVVDEGVVKNSIGYSCASTNTDMWWFPKLGFSTEEVYKDYKSAEKKAKAVCKNNINLWKERLDSLKGTFNRKLPKA